MPILLRPLQYCDLALEKEKQPPIKVRPDGTTDKDFFVIATAAKVAAFVYLLDLFRAQITFPDQVKAIVREHKRWHSWKIGIEDNAYQWALGQAVWDKGLPVIPIPSTKDKVARAQLVTPHFETGRVRLRGVKMAGIVVAHPIFEIFESEALDFPNGRNDDTVDAVTGVVQMCMDEEIVGMELHMVKGSLGVVRGGGFRRGDPYDVFPSAY
jgi:predicted phage terminase large subunit-like protein